MNVKGKLYSTQAGIINRVNALNEHFQSQLPEGYFVDRTDRVVGEGHADAGKYVLFVAMGGTFKSDHLVSAPLVDWDDTWPFAEYAPQE